MVLGSIPYSAKYGARLARQARSRPALGSARRWQKKFTLKGRAVCARMRASSPRRASTLSMAAGSEPSPPAVGHGDGQRAALHARHRRLNYRVLDPEELLQKHRSAYGLVSRAPVASPALTLRQSRVGRWQESRFASFRATLVLIVEQGLEFFLQITRPTVLFRRVEGIHRRPIVLPERLDKG